MLISLFYTRNSNNEVVQGDEGPGISRHEKPKSPASNLRKLGLARPRGDRFSTVSLFRGKDEKEQRERVKLWPKNFSEPHKSMSCNYPPVKKIDSPTKFSYFIFFPPPFIVVRMVRGIDGRTMVN